MSTILVTGASGFVGSHLVPALLAAGHRVVALVRTPTPASWSSAASRTAQREDVETRIGDVTRPETLAAGAGRCRRGRPPRRHPARLQRRRRPAPGQHRGHPRRRRRHVGSRASGGSSTWARWASTTTRPSTTRAPRRRPRRSSASRELGLDDPQAVAPVRRGRRVLQHHRRARPAVAGHRPGPGRRLGAASSRSTSRCRGGRRPSLADPTSVGGTFELGGPRYWTYREITERGPRGAGQAAAPSCRCRSR